MFLKSKLNHLFLVYLTLLYSLVCFGQPVFLLTDETQDQIYELLKEKKKTVVLAEQANRIILERSLQCVERYSCLKKSDKSSCPEVEPHDKKNHFLDGKIEVISLDCKSMISHYFGINLNENSAPSFTATKAFEYKDFRTYSALVSPEFRRNSIHLLDLSEPMYIYNSKPSSLLSKFKTAFAISYPEQSALDTDEVSYLESSYENSLRVWFSQYINESHEVKSYPEDLFNIYEYQQGRDNLFGLHLVKLDESCDVDVFNYVIRKNWSEFRENCYEFKKIESKLKVIQNNFSKMVRYKVEKTRTFALDKAYSISLRNPIFFQIANSKFTLPDLRKALLNMKNLAHKVEKKIKNEEEGHWHDLVKYMNVGSHLESFSNLFIESRLNYTKEQSQRVRFFVEEKIRRDSMSNLIKNGALIVGGMTLCLTPALRKARALFKVTKLKFLKLTPTTFARASCAYTVGMPLNSYFLYAGFKKNIDNWREALSAAELSQLQTDSEKLSAGDSEILLSLLFVPVIYKFDRKLFSIFSNKKLIARLLRELGPVSN